MQRRHRLRHGNDFARLRHKGRAYRHPLLVLSLLPNGLRDNRYGFIVTKHTGKAVTRNRIRRLLRESIRQLHPQLQSGFDIVIVTRPGVVEQPLVALKRIVEELFRRAGVLVEEDGL